MKNNARALPKGSSYLLFFLAFGVGAQQQKVSPYAKAPFCQLALTLARENSSGTITQVENSMAREYQRATRIYEKIGAEASQLNALDKLQIILILSEKFMTLRTQYANPSITTADKHEIAEQLIITYETFLIVSQENIPGVNTLEVYSEQNSKLKFLLGATLLGTMIIPPPALMDTSFTPESYLLLHVLTLGKNMASFYLVFKSTSMHTFGKWMSFYRLGEYQTIFYLSLLENMPTLKVSPRKLHFQIIKEYVKWRNLAGSPNPSLYALPSLTENLTPSPGP